MARKRTNYFERLVFASSRRTHRLMRGLVLLALALPTLAVAEVHPYQRWADELGIDLNASYDGIRVMEMKEGKFEATERRAPGKMYTEVHVSGMTSGVIVREDLNKSYILMPSMGFYKEESLDGGLMQSSNGMKFSKIEKAGTEEIIGFSSTKYKTRFEDNDGKGAGIIWVTDSGVPIKLDMMYSNGDMKGKRFTMQFRELNMRKQDPAYFELPPDLKPMGMGSISDMMKMGGAAAGAANGSPSTTAPAAPATPATTVASRSLTPEQESCLQGEAARAAEERANAEKKKGFGRLMGSIARTAGRFGLDDISSVTRDIMDADATADDMSVIAEELGISEQAAQDCMQR